MMSFSCCLWWFLAGTLGGWLLSWLFGNSSDGGGGRSCQGDVHKTTHHNFVSTDAQRSTTVDMNHWLNQARVAGITVKGMDDLEIIEGIGPKIRALLNGQGVYTFSDLAKQSTDRLQSILNAGGENFRTANPSTWAEQAKYCAEGRWDDFKRLTDRLIAGVRPTRF